jgi:hypothetical protein
MIIAIEGPSAAGKTTWCRAHCPDGFVEAAPENLDAPDLFADPREVASFWVEYNCGLWQKALDLEKKYGVAVCDGDPLHLYFSWSLWKMGALPSTLFELDSVLYRRAIERRQVGFADLILWKDAPAEELRRRAKGDQARKRKRIEIYLGMIPWMNAWYSARDYVLPDTMQSCSDDFSIESLEKSTVSSRRYDVEIMDSLLARLRGAQSLP